ncbi:MAG: serine hydroxymethyltransferase [Anaerolineae bacterium]|nr:serine hydroxymethyltransferase [Anaerolineae bacterium]
MNDFLVRGTLAELDPHVAELIEHEHVRQLDKLIMIASESYVPAAVREAEGSVFQNVYAEGYPHADMHGLSEDELLDYEWQLAFYRRNGDRRYYKGVEYCNLIEALAQRRAAEVFCPPGMQPEQVFVNVQPLSGAVANAAIYEALVQPGDTVMTLDLLHGGHLSHGSPVNITGHRQRVVHYRVSEETELLDYEEIYDLAQREKPKMIIAGYTSYPWAPDFAKFRAIADSVGAYLLADIAHTAGMAAAGVYPNPVGIAHVTSFTTHKTMMGPRGAVIITTDPELARRIDRAVFPGLQGGPHVNKIAGMATMFKLAQTPQFRELQHQIAKNAVALSDGFKANGLRVVHGGTNTHMVLLDCKSIAQHDGMPLMGNVASRILDLIGIVCNRNTIPGDKDASRPSALRFGTPWVTQRGLKEADMREIADVIALVLKTARPHTLQMKKSVAYTARVDFDALMQGVERINALVAKAGRDFDLPREGYPFVWYATNGRSRESEVGNRKSGVGSRVEIHGEHAAAFLSVVLGTNVTELTDGAAVHILGRNRTPLCEAKLRKIGDGFALDVPAEQAAHITRWLRALSDGYVIFDDADVGMNIPGPVVVK